MPPTLQQVTTTPPTITTTLPQSTVFTAVILPAETVTEIPEAKTNMGTTEVAPNFPRVRVWRHRFSFPGGVGQDECH